MEKWRGYPSKRTVPRIGAILELALYCAVTGAILYALSKGLIPSVTGQ